MIEWCICATATEEISFTPAESNNGFSFQVKRFILAYFKGYGGEKAVGRQFSF